MKIWTYLEAKNKLQVDLDLQDETFVTPNELIGYFNEGIEEAESEILKIDEDYLLTSTPIPLVSGTSAYAYPNDIYGYKERGIVYSSGSIIYDVKKMRRRGKFENIAYGVQYSGADDYRWYHTGAASGARINLIPAARETAIVPPNANTSTPMTLWYIRHAKRIPLLAEYIPDYDILLQSTAVTASNDRIATTSAYTTGDLVKLTSSITMPTGLTASTVYYVIAASGYIKLATTLANAVAGTAIDITSTGSGVLTITVSANQTVINAMLIDIPEFTKFVIQWAKCRCMGKEGDPRLSMEAALLQQQRAQMVSTLTEMQQDDQNEIEQDLSSYTEMS